MSVLYLLRGRARLVSGLMLLIFAASLAAGCSSSKKKPVEPEVPVPPTPNSPVNALALLEWCWDQRSVTAYRDVFTGDFLAEFAPSDSQAIGVTINRDEELAIANRLFVDGAPGHPAATHVSLSFNPVLTATADDRPGKNPTWHKRINTDLTLIVRTPGPSYSVSGNVTFYVTRGDSALIPADMVARGFTADSGRWYVDHWADETTCFDSKKCTTVGTVKLAYAGGPLGPARAWQ